MEQENTIDTNKLVIGDMFTYKKLCNLLNESYKSGTAKKAQLKDWLRYFNYEKEGTKFLITDIYEKPLDKNYQYPPNAIYIKYIEVLLLNLLANSEGNKIKISPQSLYNIFGMVNDKYTNIQKLEGKQRLKSVQKIHEDMTEFEVDDFFTRCNGKLSQIIKNAFESLQKRLLIKYSEDYEYYVMEQEWSCDMNSEPNIELKRYTASDNEIAYILKVKRETALKYGCETEAQIYLKKKTLPYYRDINKRISKEKGWMGLYKVYSINYCRDTSIQALQKDQLTLQKYGLNAAIIDNLNEQARRNITRAQEKLRENPEAEGIFRYPKYYVDMQEILSYELLNINKNRPKPEQKPLTSKDRFNYLRDVMAQQKSLSNTENSSIEEEN